MPSYNRTTYEHHAVISSDELYELIRPLLHIPPELQHPDTTIKVEMQRNGNLTVSLRREVELPGSRGVEP